MEPKEIYQNMNNLLYMIVEIHSTWCIHILSLEVKSHMNKTEMCVWLSLYTWLCTDAMYTFFRNAYYVWIAYRQLWNKGNNPSF